MYDRKEKAKMNKETTNDIANFPIRAIPERGISLETAQHFGIRTALDQADGQTPTAYYFPYYKEGEISGFKKKDLTVDKGSRYHFTSTGSTGTDCMLFGQHLYNGGKKLFIVEGECFPEDAEILTEYGWKKFPDLKGDEKVASWSNDHTISWVKPRAYIQKWYEGNLVQYSNKGYVSRTTPEHNLVSLGHHGEPYKHTAEEGPTSGAHHVPRTGFLNGKGLDLSDKEIMLKIAICADATMREHSDGSKHPLFGFLKKRKIDRLVWLLTSLGIEYQHWHGKKYQYIKFAAPSYARNKDFHWGWIRDASSYQRDLILKELVHWDGNLVPNRNQTEFSSKHKDAADWVQAMAHTHGMCSTIMEKHSQFGDTYKVSILETKQDNSWQQMRDKKEEIPYSGYVYCVNVPTGSIVVRQDDKVTVSGNCDAAILWQTIREGMKGTKYEGSVPSVVSIGNGTANAANHISKNMEFINKYQEVILCFDQDEATEQERKKGIMKGWDAVAAVASLIPNVKAASYSKNDPCDMYKAGKQKELRDAVMFNAQPYKPAGFVEVDDIWEEATKMPEWGKPFPWPTLTKLTYGRRKGEGYYIGAGVKCGKSEWVNQLAQHIICNEHSKIALFKLEESPGMTARRVAGKIMGKQFHIPDGNFTQEELKEGVRFIKGKALLFNAYYKSDWNSLKAAIRHAVVVEGCEDIVIDPITRLTDGLTPTETETELRRFASEISQMANDLGFVYYCFCHLRAPDTGQPHEQGGKVHSNQFRGSRAMMEATHYMLGIERNKSADLSEEERNTSQFVLLEDRVFGNVGKFPVYYDRSTGSYLEPEQEF